LAKGEMGGEKICFLSLPPCLLITCLVIAFLSIPVSAIHSASKGLSLTFRRYHCHLPGGFFRDITRSSCTIAQDYFIFRHDLNRDRYAHARATTVSAYSTWTGIIHGDSPFNVVTLSTKGFPAKREGLSTSRPKVRLSQNQFAKAIPENRKITALVR
jgi:hypothetical protein